MDLDALVAEASAILDAAVPRFLSGHRADSAIATLTESGVEGAIVGKALYAGRFTLAQALEAVGR